jgi:serine/threonine-protein kinase
MLGLEIGSYKLVSKIGEGGMGEVYLAEHSLLKRKAAVKLLLAEFTAEEMVVKRFINEARATSQLVHPGIVQIFDFGKTPDGKTYMIMEFLEGETLHARLKKGRLPIKDALRVARQVAEALAVAHANKVVHRDLKPENVFLVPDPTVTGSRERAKVLDFGIAKMLDPNISGAHTRTGSVLGTPVYMSPEQCCAAPNIDQRADLYALGCVMFHMCTGRPPFDMSGIGELLGAHLYSPPPVPSTLNPAIGPALDAVILKLLGKKPEERYPSTAELIAALDAAPVPSADAEAAAVPVEVAPQRSGPEAATMIQSPKGRGAQPTPPEAPAPAAPKTAVLPPEPAPAPAAAGAPPQKKEITTLGSATGEQQARPALPQAARKSNSFVAMGIAFGLTMIIAVGAWLLFGRGDPEVPAPAVQPPPTAPVQTSDTDAG